MTEMGVFNDGDRGTLGIGKGVRLRNLSTNYSTLTFPRAQEFVHGQGRFANRPYSISREETFAKPPSPSRGKVGMGVKNGFTASDP